MNNPILEMAIQKSELWNLKSEFRSQKSETRIQKSEIANRNSWKSEIHNWEIRNQKLDFRNATCDFQFWQSRFIPVCNIIISNIESVKSSTFTLRGWVKRDFNVTFGIVFLSGGRVSIFWLPVSITLVGSSWGVGWSQCRAAISCLF